MLIGWENRDDWWCLRSWSQLFIPSPRDSIVCIFFLHKKFLVGNSSTWCSRWTIPRAGQGNSHRLVFKTLDLLRWINIEGKLSFMPFTKPAAYILLSRFTFTYDAMASCWCSSLHELIVIPLLPLPVPLLSSIPNMDTKRVLCKLEMRMLCKKNRFPVTQP